MEDLGLPLFMLLSGLSNLTATFQLGRFQRVAAITTIIAFIVLGWLWLSHTMTRSKMMLPAQVPWAVPLLIFVAALGIHVTAFVRRKRLDPASQ